MLILGINHHKTPIVLREQFAFNQLDLQKALRVLKSSAWVEEAMILSTCNRSEIYVVTDESSHKLVWLKDWWCSYLNLSIPDIDDYFFHHWHKSAINHLSRVAAGLDSMVLGEPQILGQLKEAYTTAKKAETVGPILQQVVPHSFKVAKRVRSETDIGQYPVSVAFAAVTLAKRIFHQIGSATALLIGAGEMISLVARHLCDQGIKTIHILNRTPERAEEILKKLEVSGTFGGLCQIAGKLEQADIVVSCTGSNEIIVSAEQIRTVIQTRIQRKRGHKPIYIVDLAVPRDIDPEVDQFEDVYLFTIDDLQQVIEENRAARASAAESAEEITETATEKFIQELRVRQAASIISNYRNHAETIRQTLLSRAVKRIQQGEAPEDVLDHMSRTLMNKLIHNPTLAMREALETKNIEALNWSQKMLGLPDTSVETVSTEWEGEVVLKEIKTSDSKLK